MGLNNVSIDVRKRYLPASVDGPFQNVLNILNFFGGAGRGELLELLVRGMSTQNQLVQVHGPSGCGKTLLSLVLANRLAEDYMVVRHDVANLTERSLLRQLMLELGIPVNTRVHHFNAACRLIRRRLMESQETQKPPLLLVDASTEPSRELELLLKRLAAMNDQGRPLLRIVLFRQSEPEPDDDSDSAWFPANVYCLHPLSVSETAEYLEHRLLLHDFNQRQAFDRAMSEFIAEKSGGRIADINRHARRAWQMARREGVATPSMSHLLLAAVPPQLAAEAEPAFLSRNRGRVVLSLATLATASTAFLLWWAN